MFGNYRILGLIPARGRSDEVEHLNIKMLGNRPMLAYAIEGALKAECLDELIVSTEDEKVSAIAKKAGASVPFIRPVELSAEDAPIRDVVKHTLESMDEVFDLVAVLLPNSPFRNGENIKEAISLLVENGYDSVISVVEHRDFFWVRNNGQLKALTYTPQTIRRNDCIPLYQIKGGIEIIWAKNCLQDRYYGDNTGLYLMDEQRAMTVNSLYDLFVAERIVKLPMVLIDGLRNCK